MNLKELIKEVERLKERLDDIRSYKWLIPNEEKKEKDEIVSKLLGIKQTVEAVEDCFYLTELKGNGNTKDWQTLKKLLGLN